MKIAYASDLHFEYHRDEPDWLPPLEADADVLVLAGDIDSGTEAVESVQRVAEALPNTEILYVAGNHEFYDGNHEQLIDIYRNAFHDNANLHFLENESVELDGVQFLGCTLWSGFDAFPEFSAHESMTVAERYIPDFRLIETLHNGDAPEALSPMRMVELFEQSRSWLDQELQKTTAQHTVVITHFPPHPLLRHGDIPHGILSNYFTADCRDLMDKHQPALWIYGHNHWCDELTHGSTRLLSNQLGYPQEAGKIRAYAPRSVQLPL